MGKLQDKIILITGATSGIGRAAALLFAAEGAQVIVVGRSRERGVDVVRRITEVGGGAAFFAADIAQTEEIRALGDTVVCRYGRLDGLFNNAGVLITRNLDELDDAAWEEVYHTNVRGVMNMTKYFMPMLESSQGGVVNNASIAGIYTVGQRAYLYATSKAALIKFTQLCALNYAGRVRVNCLCPGLIDTEIYTNRDFSRFSIPMGRVGTPEEVAKAALFLMSEDASYITGAVLTVDGGALLR
ncbi:SDR family NAD(P)-dependent oxidoreductase [Selenomonas artemidis]|uniref:SDR family NAD(P)-dependent oxidoreductase n=1 Tax=Selenomonas artemidis TaxID=671224 RepID=UPI0028894961|nr:SDR family NAD(P)-dependent oxidoreductase [Selenomonas artemidis]